MDTFLTIILGVVMAAASPVAAVWANQYVNWIRKGRALARLQDNPLCYVGAELFELREPGTDRELMGPCMITVLDFGEVQVQSKDNKRKMIFTALEYEQLHPIYAANKMTKSNIGFRDSRARKSKGIVYPASK